MHRCRMPAEQLASGGAAGMKPVPKCAGQPVAVAGAFKYRAVDLRPRRCSQSALARTPSQLKEVGRDGRATHGKPARSLRTARPALEPVSGRHSGPTQAQAANLPAEWDALQGRRHTMMPPPPPPKAPSLHRTPSWSLPSRPTARWRRSCGRCSGASSLWSCWAPGPASER